MKGKIFFTVFILSFLALSFAKAQNIQFEDANFKATLLLASPENKIAKDTNGNFVAIDVNGDREISQAEALNIYYLDISKAQDITSIKGIEYFTNLTALSCNGLPKLKSLDLSKNISLQYLDLRSAWMKTMDISKNIKLETLNLGSSRIETLDISKNINLQTLDLSYCGIEDLDVSKNINLQTLNLNYSKIKTLNVSKNIDLQELDLISTEIKTLNVSKNINLKTLDLGKTKMEALDVSKNINLQKLRMFNNTEIKMLDVSRNMKLAHLDLEGCSGLTTLYMKNGAKKTFQNNNYNSYIFKGTNLSYICCNEDEIDDVRAYTQTLTHWDNDARSYIRLNPVIISECGIGCKKK